MSKSPADPSGEHAPLDPALVQAMREHGESLAPDAQSRERIWTRIEKGMAAGKPMGHPGWLKTLLWSPRRWVPVLLLTFVAAIGLPLFFDSSTEPDWSSVEFKGAATVRLDKGLRPGFIRELRQRGVAFDATPQAGDLSIMIRPDERKKLGAQFSQAWHLPSSGNAPLIVIFE